MAERSKALVLGTSLFGGVGSNPTPIMFVLALLLAPRLPNTIASCIYVSVSRLAQLVERKTLNLVVEGSSPSVGIFCP